MATAKSVEIVQLHRITSKLLELGVDEKWLEESNLSLSVSKELLKGLLLLRELYGDGSAK